MQKKSSDKNSIPISHLSVLSDANCNLIINSLLRKRPCIRSSLTELQTYHNAYDIARQTTSRDASNSVKKYKMRNSCKPESSNIEQIEKLLCIQEQMANKVSHFFQDSRPQNRIQKPIINEIQDLRRTNTLTLNGIKMKTRITKEIMKTSGHQMRKNFRKSVGDEPSNQTMNSSPSCSLSTLKNSSSSQIDTSKSQNEKKNLQQKTKYFKKLLQTREYQKVYNVERTKASRQAFSKATRLFNKSHFQTLFDNTQAKKPKKSSRNSKGQNKAKNWKGQKANAAQKLGQKLASKLGQKLGQKLAQKQSSILPTTCNAPLNHLLLKQNTISCKDLRIWANQQKEPNFAKNIVIAKVFDQRVKDYTIRY